MSIPFHVEHEIDLGEIGIHKLSLTARVVEIDEETMPTVEIKRAVATILIAGITTNLDVTARIAADSFYHDLVYEKYSKVREASKAWPEDVA